MAGIQVFALEIQFENDDIYNLPEIVRYWNKINGHINFSKLNSCFYFYRKLP